MEFERGVAGERPAAHLLPAPRDRALEQPGSLPKCPPERLLLMAQRLVDQTAVLRELGPRTAQLIHHRHRQIREHRLGDAEQPRMPHRPTDQPTQDEAAAVVRREDTVGQQERSGTHVVGDDPTRASQAGLAYVLAGELRQQVEGGCGDVGLVDVVDLLQDHGHPVESQAGVDAGTRQRADDRDVLVVAALPPNVPHEDEAPQFEVTVGVDGRPTLGPIRRTPVVEDLRARPARTGTTGGPEVVLGAEPLDPVRRDPDLLPQHGRLLVVEVDGRPQPARIQAESVREELERPRDQLVLAVVAEGEVAEHLERRQVPVGTADVVDVDRAYALLQGGQPRRGRGGAEEVRLERNHPRRGQEQRRVVGHQR